MNREWTRAHFSSAWWEPSGAGLLYEQNRMTSSLNKIWLYPTQPCLSCLYLQTSLCELAPSCATKHTKQCAPLRKKHKSLLVSFFFFLNVLFGVLSDRSLLALICEILVAVQLYLLKFGLLGASLTCFGPPPLPVTGVPAPSQGDPWHLRKGEKYLRWSTLSTGLKKGHREPKKRE